MFFVINNNFKRTFKDIMEFFANMLSIFKILWNANIDNVPDLYKPTVEAIAATLIVLIYPILGIGEELDCYWLSDFEELAEIIWNMIPERDY